MILSPIPSPSPPLCPCCRSDYVITRDSCRKTGGAMGAVAGATSGYAATMRVLSAEPRWVALSDHRVLLSAGWPYAYNESQTTNPAANHGSVLDLFCQNS
jgi:hypothetical protein